MSLAGRLRRIALDRQGLLKSEYFGRGKKAVLRAIEHLGYVQIDTISVVARAHHHVLWSRVGNFRPEFLDRLMAERKVFEYWFHAAAWLPMRDFRFALPRMNAMHGDRSWFPDSDPALLRRVLRRIETEGPLRARDFSDPDHQGNGWWEWKPAKQALEQLFMQGELMVSARDGFQKKYDLRERVLPDWVDTSTPTTREYASHLVDTTLRAHGFASLSSFAYLRKGQTLRKAIRDEIEARLETGELARIEVSRGAVYYIEAELLDRKAPRGNARVRLLSPFDNSVIQRQRVREIFGFDYQIECYLPQEKREFGYFCLPIMYRERFVGRADCKAHRDTGSLEIRSLYIEQPVDRQFSLAMAEELSRFASFNGCERIRTPQSGSDAISKQLAALL